MEIELQGNLVKVTGKTTPIAVTSKRGKVNYFSSKSRMRLLEIIARLATVRQALFLTLTYGQEFPTERVSKKHLKAFIRRIRKAYPRIGIIWRLEYQKRGAPHFHLIIFNVPYIPKNAIAWAWFEVIGSQYQDNSGNYPRPPFTRVEAVNNNKKVMLYVSKYVAKVESNGFNYLPYRNRDIHTGKFTAISPGRFWGISGKKLIEFAVKIVWKIKNVATLDTLCEAAKIQWPEMRFRRHASGFKMFCDNYRAWLQLVIECEKYFDYALKHQVVYDEMEDIAICTSAW